MKKIFTLAAILFSVTTFAADPHPNDSKVAIRSNSDAFIQVFIDGKQYNMNHNNGFVLDIIRSGRHRVEVYKVENYGMRRRRPQRIYSDVMVVKPWESLNININRFENVFVDTRFDRDDRRGNDRDYGRGRDYNNGPDYNDHDGHNRH
jgi:hypothetical protein